jgi:hypothetical protein
MIREVAFVGSDLFSGELLAFAFGGCDLIRGNYWPLMGVTLSEGTIGFGACGSDLIRGNYSWE